MQLVPHAVPDDNQLALTYATRISKLSIILSTWRFYNGSIGKHPKVYTDSVSELNVKPHPQHTILVEADGEMLGEAPCSFSIIPKALQIIIP